MIDVTTKKHSTIRDVAKLAGVSVATVSYVMNGKTDKRIPDPTRKKVYQAISLLNYSPNAFAVGLSAHQTPDIIVRTSEQDSWLHEAHTISIVAQLSKQARSKGYDVVFGPDKTAVKLNYSACVSVNMSKSQFYQLSNENYIPMIALDIELNDPIFYQVSDNYLAIAEGAQSIFGEQYSYICLTPFDEQTVCAIDSSFANYVFVDSINGIRAAIAKYNNIAVSQNIVRQVIAELGVPSHNVYFYNNLANKCLAVVESVDNAIQRKKIPGNQHFLKV